VGQCGNHISIGGEDGLIAFIDLNGLTIPDFWLIVFFTCLPVEYSHRVEVFFKKFPALLALRDLVALARTRLRNDKHLNEEVRRAWFQSRS